MLTKTGSKCCWEIPARLWSCGMVLTEHVDLQGLGSPFYAILGAMKTLPGRGGLQPWWFDLELGLDNLHHSKGQLENISKDESGVYSWQHQDQTPDSVRLIRYLTVLAVKSCSLGSSRTLSSCLRLIYLPFHMQGSSLGKIKIKTKVFNCLFEKILLFIICHLFHTQSLKCIHPQYELLILLCPLPSHLK